MPFRTSVVAALVLVSALDACSADGGAPNAAPGPAGASTIASCASGQRPTTDGACVAVGATTVPEGFEADPSGWGFRAILPDAPCSGATIARIGARACEPIDDCASSFPPAEAKIVVRASGAPVAGRPDVVVVTTLDQALARAQANDTIALDEGTFATAPITKSVALVGRCTAKTTLEGGDIGFTLKGVTATFRSLGLAGSVKASMLVDSHAKITLDHVWFHGKNSAINVGNGSSVQASRTVFEGPKTQARPGATNGVYAVFGGRVALSEVELRGYQSALVAQSVETDVAITRSVIHEERTLGAEPEAITSIAAFLGAHVRIEESALESQVGRMALVGSKALHGSTDETSPGDPPATIRVARSAVVHRVVPRERGSVIDVVDGASLELDGISMFHESLVGVGVSDSGTATVRASTIRAGDSATNARSALTTIKRGKVVVEDTSVVDASVFAIVVDGAGEASLRRSLVVGSRAPGCNDPSAFMQCPQAITLGRGARATLEETAVLESEGTALFLEQATASLSATLVGKARPTSAGAVGAAVVAVDSALVLDASVLSDNPVGLALKNGRALVKASTVAGHHEALRLDGIDFVQTNDAFDDAPDGKIVATKTVFSKNDVLVAHKSVSAE